MLIGVFFGIAACMIWGCVYVAPLILPDYSPVHIAMMRYLVFGMLAAGLAVPEWRELKSYSPRPANAQERRLQAPSRR